MPRAPRCTIGLRHYRNYHQPAAFTPTARAVTGALDIYLEGRRLDDARRMLFGLSVLRSATVGQVEAALAIAGATIADLSDLIVESDSPVFAGTP